VHYCKVCGFKTHEGLAKLLEHVLDAHAHEISPELGAKFRAWLWRRWRCEDCAYCGVTVVPDYYGNMKKPCPAGYLWNHPDPLRCPNFVPKEA